MTAQETLQETLQKWHVVGLAHDLKPGSVLPGFTGNTEMAIWRDESRQVHAFDVRCPHRGMRLSQGFVRNNNLACPYHGWQYGADGHCAYIPAHPELPPSRSIRAGVYPCVERYGLIWSSEQSIAGKDANESTEPPELKDIQDDTLKAVRSYVVDRRCSDITDLISNIGSESTNAGLSIIQSDDPHIDTARSIHPDVILLSAGDMNDAQTIFVIALQTMGHAKTGLHLLVNNTNVDLKIAARWGARLRNRLEESLVSKVV